MAYHNSRPRTPPVCPVCQADVPPRALACPECGADHRSGWKASADLDGLDLPDEDFDYDEFVKNEFGPAAPSIRPIWWITAAILLLAFALGLVLSIF